MNIPELFPVTSTNVQAIGYDTATSTLFVQFPGRKGAAPSVYQYRNFPPQKWDAFWHSPSKGSFLQSEVRPHYQGHRVQ